MKQRARATKARSARRLHLAFLAAAGLPALTVGAAMTEDELDSQGAVTEESVSRTSSQKHQVYFREIASRAGVSYRRVKSPRDAIADELKARDAVRPDEQPFFPMKPHGAPGVAIIDYDNDGDEDLFIPNGPGVAHSLYKNLLRETGRLKFVDVAASAGVAAIAQDGSGVCFGDTDNDGDKDLLVLGTNGNRFFQNRGNGRFVDRTAASGFGATELSAASCSFGDVNGDSLLDVVIANSFKWESWVPMMVEPFALNQQEQLFINQGSNVFVDRASESGIANFSDISWAIAMVDYDQDGDVDIIEGTDQAPIPPLVYGGVDRGDIRVYRNDGAGSFEDVTAGSGLDNWGFWMGLSFADFNGDGYMDIFASNIGAYTMRLLPIPHANADQNSNSKWFFGGRDGKFTDPGLGSIKATPFGWGSGAFDYDNDGDSDLVFYGGFEMPLMTETSNPGALLRNNGRGVFSRDAHALTMKHSRRDVKGVAVGDLNGDGFVDIVTAAAARVPTALPLLQNPVSFGGPFDVDAKLAATWTPQEDGRFRWSGVNLEDGDVTVEINSGNGNRWSKVRLLGGAGLISGGKVNRDGIGAVATVKLSGNGKQIIKPVLGGSSYASQESLDVSFGMGAKRGRTATVDIQWPGGVRNRLYDVRAFERITFPEIPCSYAGNTALRTYTACVTRALAELGACGTLSRREQSRFLSSAIRAYHEEHRKK